MTSIGDDAFSCCAGLTVYGVDGSAVEAYASQNGISFIGLAPCLRFSEDGETCSFAGVEPIARPRMTAGPTRAAGLSPNNGEAGGKKTVEPFGPLS